MILQLCRDGLYRFFEVRTVDQTAPDTLRVEYRVPDNVGARDTYELHRYSLVVLLSDTGMRLRTYRDAPVDETDQA